MLSPIFGDKLYLNLVYFFCPWRFSTLLLSSVFTWTSVQRSAKQFYRRNRFTFVCVLCWYIEHHECLCCTPLKEDTPVRVACFFYKRKVGIAAICLGLQNALNISDNRSIYNYYAVIIYSGLQLRNFGWGWNRAKKYCVTMINSDKWFYHQEQKKRSKWALCDKRW